MAKEIYNWWTDPKNKEEVERHSWWNHDKNKTFFNLPISVIETDGWWVATCNSDTEKFLGDKLHAVAQGKTKEEAIKMMFELIQMSHEYSEECVLKYQRWVPFRKGDWSQIGGKWFVMFGIHVYFRVGKRMQGGFYIPLTKLNISIYSEWKTYNDWKRKQKQK